MTHKLGASTLSRRSLLAGAAVAGALHAMPLEAVAGVAPPSTQVKLKFCVFSKVLQWADVSQAAAIARDAGFDGVDFTVRAKGHILPERVEADLPKAVEAVRRAGLEVPTISTDITSIDSPHAEAILKTASQLGIAHYRLGGITYKPNQDIAQQLDWLKPQARALANLNQQYKICGLYHTHSGPGMIGGPVWDAWLLFAGLDPRYLGINYDIGHATVEGGYGGWETSARLVKNSMRGIALKDFFWPARNKAAAYAPQWCAMGEGVVDFPGFFSIVKANNFSGPVQVFFEQPLGGAENGATQLTISKQELIAAITKDLHYVKETARSLDMI
jgi:L-ribulose-5-phosphate 3-epimerase